VYLSDTFCIRLAKGVDERAIIFGFAWSKNKHQQQQQQQQIKN